MKFTKSIKLLTLLLLVQSFEGIVPLRAGESASKPQKAQGDAPPDSLSKKPDDLDSTVVYTAKDSLIYNINKRTADLFGKAKVNYRGSRIEGPRITIEQAKSTARAMASRDSLGHPAELPVYTDKDGSFSAETMTYNYKTRIGTASDMSSKSDRDIYSGGSDQAIYSGKNVRYMPSGEIYIEDGVYTTCDLEEPHYWFAGKHMKIIPDDRLISRPFVMYIHPEIFHMRLPALPVLYLPYMSAPISNKRASGFLFPRIGSSGDLGTTLSNLGYFWAINDYADLRLEGDISFKGSWRLGERFRYQNGDLYSGSISGEYEKIILNSQGDPDYARYNNRDLRIEHHQQFDPTARLDANLQYLGGDRYYSNTSIDPENLVTDQATSYASFSKSWDENNRVLMVGYQRVDNLSTDELTQTATASLYQNRIYLFRPRLASPEVDWRSRFFLQPTLSGSGQFDDADGVKTDFYTGNAGLELGYLQDFSPGYRALFTQGINVQALRKTVTEQNDLNATSIQLPFKIQTTLFKYLNLTPAVTFSQYRVNSTVSKEYVGGEEVTNTINEPATYATTVFSLDAQTRLYGVMNTGFLDKLTGLTAIRHTFIPTVSFIYNPDYRGSGYDIYDSYLNPDTGETVRYNRFGESLYADVPEKRTFVGISLQNLFHGKFRSNEVSNENGDGDSSGAGAGAGYKTVQLLSLTASSGYNFAADSFPVAPLVLTASSNALSPALMFSAGATYDFYTYDPATGDRVDKLAMDDGKGLLRFVNGFLNMSVSMSGHLHTPVASDENQGSEASLVRKKALPVEQAIYKERFNTDELTKFSSSLPWSLRMSIYLISDKSNPLEASSTALLNSAAQLALSKNWQVGLNTGYDMTNNEFVYPALMIFRDLHDFQFSAQWVPSGEHKGYLFQIAMKPANLKYLKLKAGGGNIVQPLD
ncbi:putative LPS assembly protein LptD [Chlorobaculum sp. 24CR]|uniref:putative LPS assembly protein LptD n=1 Tax=Chlorobaculum sp. 24CR TaxID=2508878 RepID=UPI001FD63BE5|nr:putative LPS assembly protein LptD [Chlorobaculum sp. 24CR]